MAALQMEATPLEGMCDEKQTELSPTVKEKVVPPAQDQLVEPDIEVEEAQEMLTPLDEEKGHDDDDETVDEDEVPGAIPIVDEDYEAAFAANGDTTHDFTAGKDHHELEDEDEEDD